MVISQEEQNIIQRFLRDELSAEDKIKFDELIKDREFAFELKRQSDILLSLDKLRQDDIRKTIGALANMSSDNKDPNRHKKNLLLYGATIVLILLIFFLINLLSSEKPTKAYYAEYFKPYPIENIERGAEDIKEGELYKEALALYSRKEYSDAFDKFNRMENKSSKVDLYKAICLLEMRKPIASEKLLSEMSEEELDITMRYEVEWYRALANLKIGDFTKTEGLLTEISDNDLHPYKKQAMELLLKLKS